MRMVNEKNNMWTVYLAFGHHTIYNVSDEEFEHTKKFYKLFETEPNKFQTSDLIYSFGKRKENEQ